MRRFVSKLKYQSNKSENWSSFCKNNGALLEIVKPIKLGFGAVLGKRKSNDVVDTY